MRKLLVVVFAESELSFVLLIGSVIDVRSFSNSEHDPHALKSPRLRLFQILGNTRLKQGRQSGRPLCSVQTRLLAITGVQIVAAPHVPCPLAG